MNSIHTFMTALSSFMEEGVMTLKEAEDLSTRMLDYTGYDPVEILEELRKPSTPRPKTTKTT